MGKGVVARYFTFNTDVKAISNFIPCCNNAEPAAAASFLPSEVNSTSAQPVNLFSLFHSD
jgi:hypothetical protein